MSIHTERRAGNDCRADCTRRESNDRRDADRSHRLPRRVRGDRRERNAVTGRRATD